MSREKKGYRECLEELNRMFPDQGMLNKSEVARFLGVDRSTVTRRGIRFHEGIGRVTKADLARQVCL